MLLVVGGLSDTGDLSRGERTGRGGGAVARGLVIVGIECANVNVGHVDYVFLSWRGGAEANDNAKIIKEFRESRESRR